MNLKAIFKRLHERILENGSIEGRVKYLRRQGVKIGHNCMIVSLFFSTEPFLIEIGNDVEIAGGVKFITHDGSIRCFRELEGGIFGKIKIGNNVFIGTDCIILYNTIIGDNCIVGAGSIVRGQFPDNSVIMGNPAKVVLSMNIQRMLYRHNPGFVKTNDIPEAEATKLVKKHFGIE